MAWIKVEQSLLNHRKTMQLGEHLDLDEVYVIGHVVALWLWAVDNAPGGVLPESDRQIAKACHWDGPAEPFVKALTFAGFIDDDYMGKRTIHDWERWCPIKPHFSARKVWNTVRDTIAPQVFKRDGNVCAECGATEDLTIDHIKPISKGGGHEAENLRVLCRSCNSRKKDRYGVD